MSLDNLHESKVLAESARDLGYFVEQLLGGPGRNLLDGWRQSGARKSAWAIGWEKCCSIILVRSKVEFMSQIFFPRFFLGIFPGKIFET